LDRGSDNYARLWIGGHSYLLRESLQILEQRARAHGFIRAHRRALVRLDGVRELMDRAGVLRAVSVRRENTNLRAAAALRLLPPCDIWAERKRMSDRLSVCRWTTHRGPLASNDKLKFVGICD